MRLLFIVQKLRQGWGGAPESVRLMANQLQFEGITSDVYDEGRLVEDVGALALLPPVGAVHPPFELQRLGRYGAILHTGPWQRPAGAIRAVLDAREPGTPVYYLPRGGLGYAEFARPRDLKKILYFTIAERRFLRRADGVVLSSETERRNLIPPARALSAEHVIPDFIAPPNASALAIGAGARPLGIGFLAEISPRKGLLPLIEGFVGWSRGAGRGRAARLVVGGAARPGSEAYLARAMALRAANPDLDISFLGAVPHDAREAFYAGIDVMAVTSSFESYGLTVFEALARGCALLATPNIGALEFVPHDLPLVTAASGKAPAIAAAIERSAASGPRGEAERARTRMAAGRAIERVNEIARERWSGLLRRR